MHMSNGLSDPVGLWLGHLMFDSIFSVILATILVVVWATSSNQFHGLGFFVSHRHSWQQRAKLTSGNQWLILVLYGIIGALFAYCVSLLVTSPLAAFAAVAAYQYVMFVVSNIRTCLCYC
jgi:ATP-binding cassette, subfamily A (ABC1), member 3